MDSGSTLPRRQLGRYLREARTALNLSQERVAELTGVSSSVVQRVEKGISTRLKAHELQAICEVLEMSREMTDAMTGLLQQGGEMNWWHEYGHLIPATFDVYVGLETAARKLAVYQPSLVHGLLQTADYARALIEVGTPGESAAERDRRVELRMKRQTILTRRHCPLMLDVVLHEAALRSAIGGPKIMSAQNRHLAEIGKLPNVTLRALPFSAGAPVGHPVGQFATLEFDRDAKGVPVSPPIVYLETFTACMYLEKPNDLHRYDEVHDSIRRASLNETESRSLLRQVAKEFSA
ncbi:helix-turn-helix domain-containing protein [Nocardia sp. NBC_00508]|uniref:helix-turn-helix domain-containing protein n=1 Tax=Nocardia sp. NBC_00508 TaxID=2975992 RepID=UPI002E80F8E3|nr:helix-turn-helix transcriptional regulator [Nocardia sp. NBC_00508]WUD64349.1 helix-turn-helix domain-containing protein [Nocardia sp. NBC_00508]